MVDDRLSIQIPEPVNVTVSTSGTQGPGIVYRTVSQTLGPASPNVTEFGTMNSWTVSSPTNVVLPTMPNGFQTTVKVSGFQNITWQGGTVVHGTTPASEAWITLVRDAGVWNVLIPSNEPVNVDAVRDSGWVSFVAGTSMGGSITYSTGSISNFTSADTVSHGTTPLLSPYAGTKNSFNISYRRLGNQVYLSILGIARNATSAPAHGAAYLTTLPQLIRPEFYVLMPFVKTNTAVTTPDAFNGTGYLSVLPDGRCLVRGMASAEMIGHSVNGDSMEAGGVLLTWTTSEAWPD